MKSKKVLSSLFGVFLLSLFACSAAANKNNIDKVEEKLDEVCSSYGLFKECVTKDNGKVLRTINYFREKPHDATIYYPSGRVAKTVVFDEQAQLSILFVYPDIDRSSSSYDEKNEYDFTFKNGKFISMRNHGAPTFISINHTCIEDAQDATKCNELNFFTTTGNTGLHPVLYLPLKNKDLDVLKLNGIKFQ